MRKFEPWLINAAILAVITIWVILPLVYGFSMAFMPKKELYKVPPNLVPHNPTLENFKRVFSHLNISRIYLNTLVTAGITVGINLFFSTLAGYAFAKFRFFAKEILFSAFLLKLMIPMAALVIPWFYIVGTWGLIDSIFALPLPGLCSMWIIFFMRQYIRSVPNELIDAARLDGSSEIGIFFRIILPLIKPAIGASTLVNLMFIWNWFLWPIIILQSQENFIMNIGIHFIRWLEATGTENPTDYGTLMAISILFIMPFMVFFISFYRYFVRSITMTGLRE